MRCLDGIRDSMDMNLGKPQEMMRDREAWRVAVHGVTKNQHDLATEQQQPKHKAIGCLYALTCHRILAVRKFASGQKCF